MSQDFIFSKTQELEEEIPDETILQDIAKVKIEDLRNEVYANDTILCLKINDYFEIYEWRKQEFVRVDKVSEYSSANYRDLKTYSVY
jgi:hypothetical protein